MPEGATASRAGDLAHRSEPEITAMWRPLVALRRPATRDGAV